MQKRFFFYTFIALLIFTAGCRFWPEKLTEDQYAAALNQEITGNLAYQVTDYVEDFWRVPGNAGFDSSIYRVVNELEQAGFTEASRAEETDRFVYYLEKRPMDLPAWEPVSGFVQIAGEQDTLLNFATNRNMIAINSFSTPPGGVTGEVVFIDNVERLETVPVKGKIVFTEAEPRSLYRQAMKKGAAGVISSTLPTYIRPAVNQQSIQFKEIPLDTVSRGWSVPLSYAATTRLKKKMEEGPVFLKVQLQTKMYPSEELTVYADILGEKFPGQRLVFSAHVQEPGANDNASGVGAAVEMAATTARLVTEGRFSPQRTITFLWGDEIASTRRFVKEHNKDPEKVVWGISLDMVGENTALTGGSFLIEKMPDPSAIWTRGKDQHTEWGGTPMELSDMKPHYLNDFMINRFKKQGLTKNWEVNVNPYEGGSDHVPFLRAGVPSVLLWHFTDQFYHTDQDRMENVSRETLANVSIAALEAAYTLVNADAETARRIVQELMDAGLQRLTEEKEQGKLAVQRGESEEEQGKILQAWKDWYIAALESTEDLIEDHTMIRPNIKKAVRTIKRFE